MTDATTDSELLARYARTSDEAAFAELVRRHLDGVYSAALRRVGGDTHLAEDVAQRVFVALARKAAGVAAHPIVTSWLYAVTRNEAANLVRTERRRRAREQEAMTMHDERTEPGAAADWSRVAPVLDEIVDELSEADRVAILLRFVDRRPFAEIGAALRVSEDAARMRVDRALEKMRALLGRRGVTSTTAALGVALGNHAVVAAPAGLASAVTGAALTSVAATAGVLTFMSTGKIAATLIAIGGLVGVGLGVYGIKQRDLAEASRLAALQERDDLRASLRRAEARVTDAEARIEKLDAQLAASAKPAAIGSSMTTAASPDDAALALLKAKTVKAAEEKRILGEVQAKNPDTQRLMLEAQRATLPLRFGPLYARLGLAPDQIARFEQRLAAESEVAMDVAAAARAKGLRPDDPAVATLANREMASFLEDARGILGEAGLQEYQNYNRTYSAREAVNGMLGNMLAAQAPLTADQVDQLTQLVANHSAGYQNGGRIANRGSDVAWRDVITDATPLLSPPQLQVLRAAALQADMNGKIQAVTDTMLRGTSDSGAAGATVPKG